MHFMKEEKFSLRPALQSILKIILENLIIIQIFQLAQALYDFFDRGLNLRQFHFESAPIQSLKYFRLGVGLPAEKPERIV